MRAAARTAFAVATLGSVGSLGTVAGARPAGAQQVLLQIRPHPGDTLHMRFDQEMDYAGSVRRAGADSTPGAGAATMVTRVTTTWCVLQRLVVERADSSGTDVLGVTDSVAVATVGARASEAAARQTRAMTGKRVWLRVAPDGAMAMLDSSTGVSSAVREVLANLPVTFPRRPVRVGQSWIRSMTVPAGAGYVAGEPITLQFRLDSVSATGDSAFVSVRGPLGSPRVDTAFGGERITSRASLTGTMLIDRTRGWLTDWHATIAVQSIISAPHVADSALGRMRMTVTQWFRTVDRP